MRDPYTPEFNVGRQQERLELDRILDSKSSDLIINRADRCIHLCELKFSQDLFAVDKQVSLKLASKQCVFQLRTQTKKTLFLTMITAHGLKPNSYAEQIPCRVILEELFRL